MKIGVESVLREGQLSLCKQTVHPVWFVSLVIHSLLKNKTKKQIRFEFLAPPPPNIFFYITHMLLRIYQSLKFCQNVAERNLFYLKCLYSSTSSFYYKVKVAFESRENATVSFATLCSAVCMNDVMNKADMRGKSIKHVMGQPLVCSLVKSEAR